MKRRKILVVAMLDSIHTARWLSQFQDEEIDFIIFGSKKHKHLHPNLILLLKASSKAGFKLARFNYATAIAGYLDFFLFILLPRIFSTDLRKRCLISILNKKKFDYVHALEIQGAGYLVDGAIRKSGKEVKFILTNWGSDIYFFERYPEHKMAIQSSLQTATHYSAECWRDYALAKDLGFSGIELPCIPNAGGFDLSLIQNQSTASTRTNIVAKAYGGDFGRGDLVIDAISLILQQFNHVSVFLYSVTDDLVVMAEKLKAGFPTRVDYSDRRTPLSRSEMAELFLKSRVYVGASRSDGISTSFLEALIAGCYPVQTKTSCANEWVNIGATATLVDMDVKQISDAIENALHDGSLVDHAQENNRRVAESHLSSDVIRPVALTFYSY